MTFLATLRRDWLSNPRADILAGIVVSLALIPEAIGFSIIAGVDPRVGLYASVAIAIIISFTGGRPGMISAATAAVAVLVIPLVRPDKEATLFSTPAHARSIGQPISSGSSSVSAAAISAAA